MRRFVEISALKEAKREGIDKEGRVMTEGDHYYNKPLEFAMHTCAFYECNSCKKPYYGGLIDCEEEMAQADEMKKENLLCLKCQKQAYSFGTTSCAKHGDEFITWKCMWCCSEALFRCCGNNYYFCEECHDVGKKWEDCKGVNCPLGVPHPPIGDNKMISAMPLGCSVCRSEAIEKYNVLGNNDFS